MDETKPMGAALDDLIAAIARDGGMPFAAVLYGSAARGDWSAGQSDVNLLLVVDDPSPAALGRLSQAIRGWHEQGYTPPLLMGRDEWRRATDVFPIELTDMQVKYRVLSGEDPVADLVVAESDLRRALESAYRGKLIRLRQAYLRFGEQPAILAGFATATASELLVLLRATARLLGRTPETDPGAIIDQLGDLLGSGSDALREIIAHRRTPEWACEPSLFVNYIKALVRLVKVVDTHSPPGAE